MQTGLNMNIINEDDIIENHHIGLIIYGAYYLDSDDKVVCNYTTNKYKNIILTLKSAKQVI